MATVARTPDAELLHRLRARDRLAWEELYVAYQPRLRGFAYRLAGNAHDADDLVQETFVRAVPQLDRLDPDTADVGAYLFATMRNLFLKQVERTRRQQPVAEVPEPTLPTPLEDDPERSTLLRRQQDDVRTANARLQPRQRLVLALRELEERSYAEIGELVGMKENAVAQLIFRARESLRTELRLLQVDPARLPEECRGFLPPLAAHLDGQLKGARRDETLAHLEGCERCQAALADMQEASRRYRTLLLPPAADEARAREEIDARLTSAGYWGRRRGRVLARRSTRVAALGAAVLLLGGGGTAAGIALSKDDRAAMQALTTSAPAPETTSEPIPTTAPGTTTAPPTATVTSETTATTEAKPETESAPESEPMPTAVEPTPQPLPQPGPEPKPPAPTPVDTIVPVVTITSAPPATTASAGARIAFRASERGVTFECKLDAAPYTPCTSPALFSSLAPGAHRFAVRATDEAGNTGPPATVTWTFVPPDTTPPVVTIDSAPPASTRDSAARFSFSANEPGSTFECSLDGAVFAGCTSPASYARLKAGPHTFSVRATDPAGNIGQPATHSWTIEARLPDLVITGLSKFSVTVTNRGTATAGASVLTISLVGTFDVPSLPPGASATFTWSTCRAGLYTAVADRTQVVAESDESNNTVTLRNTCP